MPADVLRSVAPLEPAALGTIRQSSLWCGVRLIESPHARCNRLSPCHPDPLRRCSSSVDVVRVTSLDRTDTLRPLSSVEYLTTVLARSTAPVFLFKHSETCGMSWQAREEVSLALADAAWDTPVYVVSVQRARPVSNEIARRLQVHHASPQLILIADGGVRWQASHMSITADAMRRVVAALPPLS